MIDPVELVRIPAVFSEQEMLFVCKFLLQENTYMELIADMALTIFLVKSFSPKLRWTELQHKWCIATWQRDHKLRSSAFPDWGTRPQFPWGQPGTSSLPHREESESTNSNSASVSFSFQKCDFCLPSHGKNDISLVLATQQVAPPTPLFFFSFVEEYL